MYLSKNSTQVLQSNSEAQAGSGLPYSLEKYVPLMNGRLIKTANALAA
jgi:hypothetical protein